MKIFNICLELDRKSLRIKVPLKNPRRAYCPIRQKFILGPVRRVFEFSFPNVMLFEIYNELLEVWRPSNYPPVSSTADMLFEWFYHWMRYFEYKRYNLGDLVNPYSGNYLYKAAHVGGNRYDPASPLNMAWKRFKHSNPDLWEKSKLDQEESGGGYVWSSVADPKDFFVEPKRQ
jgi:hypothetical protein